jgi:hypothetical protein
MTDISMYEACQIARQCLDMKEELPDDYLELMVRKFDGRSKEEHWDDFRDKYDLDDPKTQAILKVCKVFLYLAEEGNSFTTLKGELK